MAKATKPSPQMLRQIREFSEERPPDSEVSQVPSQEVNKEKPLEEEFEQQQMKVNDEAWAKKRIQEIEEEIKILAKKRQEEMRKRYEQKKEQEQKQKEQPLEISSKPKKGMPVPTGRQAFWGKRIKTAQQQAQPETAGRRVSG